MMKLMMATALVTVSVISGFIEAAEAQVRGRKYSTPSDITFQYSVVSKTRGGQIIEDQDNSIQSGFFPNAIQDFSYFDNFPPESRSDGFINLDFELGGLRSLLINGDNIIRYTFFSGNIVRSIGFSAPNKKNVDDILSGEILTFELDVRDSSDEDKYKAVNDLLFIIQENLLFPQNEKIKNIEFTNNIKTAKKSKINIPSIPLNADDRDYEITDIPEPSATTSILVLGSLSTALTVTVKVQKRTKSNSQR
ncbi:MAG TPA: hypothetical protein DD379_11895 [Cyanobacteria bacterium UBA11162]|nr:hypothetical protein [Cyanobacteria bacterium UBA11162]